MPPPKRIAPVPGRIDKVSRPAPKILEALSRSDLSPQRRLQACARLIACGEIGTAVKHLTVLMEVPGLERQVAALLAQCRRLKALGVEAAPGSSGLGQREGAGEEVGYWSAPAGSETTVVAFTGRAKRLGVSMYFMERVLAQHDVNAIYLFDWKDACFLGGVSGLGTSVESAAKNLGRMCAEMGTRRLICLGQSWGGYAAIRYGAELDADAVIAFSPEILRVMGGAGLERIRAAVGGEVDPADLDLRLLLSRRHRTPRTWIVYGAGNAADTRSAEYLAGLPGVVQRAVPGINHHAIMAPLVISGRFSRIFERISAEVGPGRWRADSTHQ